MRPFVLYYSLALFLTASTAHARSYGACKGRSGLPGTCIPRATCSASGGSYEPGLCAGPTDIQCCTKPNNSVGKSCKIKSGATGVCKQTSDCNGVSTPGFCPGAKSVQCCTKKAQPVSGVGAACTVSGVKGSCRLTSTKCSGTYTPGRCPGPSNVQCCTPPPSSGGPVPHLDTKRAIYAHMIVAVAKTMGLPKRACEVAIATAFQESGILVLANPRVLASMSIPHDKTGTDNDSVGIFQQRAGLWCPKNVRDCMGPASSARKFFSALKKVSGWQNLGVTAAAQRVQRSAFPNAYQKHVGKAADICNKIW